MKETKTTAPVLEVARQHNTVFIRVSGMATFSIGPALKQFGMAAIEEGCNRMVLDAAACETMDSTFLGILAGMAARLAKQTCGAMLILNVPDKLFETLSTLGLDRLIECRRRGPKPEPLTEPPLSPNAMNPMHTPSADRQTTRNVMLEAHTNLAAVSAENELRFKDVLAYLREDLPGHR